MAEELVTLSSLIPQHNILNDATGDLSAFLDDILQPILDSKIQEIYDFSKTFDPDVASEAFLDAILFDFGNPFDIDELTVARKRKLIRILIDMYREKGTVAGIENAIRFLTGVDVRVVSPSISDAWVLGVDILDPDGGALSAILGPELSFTRFSFDIETDDPIPSDLQDAIRQIVMFTKPAHTHFVSFITVTTPALEAEWVVGESDLDDTTILGPGDQSL